ncbi:MAG: uracil-DNA glycosylase [Armatimonadota bacterium]
MTENNSSIAAEIEGLRKEVLTCRNCELCETRSNVVFGEGNPDTPLVIVGEGPGENEDATGRPFVGRAGTLLDQALRECGLTRKHIFIANVIKCRACISENGRVKNRPPRIGEVAACLPWLERQLEIIKPLVILCLGAPSANTIIHKDFRMTQERGRFFESKYTQYAIAALHPAYILRQDGETYEKTRISLIADIAAARRRVIEIKKGNSL